jgi:hypothetical protein
MAVLVWTGLLAITVSPAAQAAARGAGVTWLLDPIFHDWHVVRQGWAQAAAGGDPLASPEQPYNYPRAVLVGAALGGAELPVAVAGLTLAAALLAGLVWWLWPRSPAEALLAAALLASPPLLLLIERGNLDAVALLGVLAGLALAARAGVGGPIAGVGCVLGAAAVKLFPAVVLVGMAGRWRGWRRGAAAAALAGFAGWAMLRADEIALILRKTTRGLEAAYGRMLAGSRLHVEALAGRAPTATDAAALRDLMQFSLVAALVLLAWAAWLGWRRRARWAAAGLEERTAGGLAGGALIYAGTFLLGHNWAYRLVFLLLCVPGLWRLAAAPATRRPGRLLLAGVAVMLFSPFRLGFGWFLAREVVAWALAAGLLGLAVAVMTARVVPGEKAICAPPGPTYGAPDE